MGNKDLLEEFKSRLRREHGYTILEDVVVNGTEHDLGLALISCSQIAVETNKYSRCIYFSNKDRRADAKSIMEVMCLAAARGSKLDILVEGIDNEALKTAARLYSGITAESEDGRTLNFSEFDNLGLY